MANQKGHRRQVIEWHEAVKLIRPHVVQISTPSGSGTGFLVSRSSSTNMCGIATAAHVVEEADEWEQPIKIDHSGSDATLFLRPDDRVILLDNRDTAVILFEDEKELSLPEKPLDLIEEGKFTKVGVELGWVGFPYVVDTLCFFSGRVSARTDKDRMYWIDGVAINGVSGGPAFTCRADRLDLVGVVSAYKPNRATGTTLPGLLVVRHVHQFQQIAKKMKSMDEAAAQKQKECPEPKKE